MAAPLDPDWLRLRSFPALDRCPRGLPRAPTARHRRDVGVSHFLQIVRRQRGTKTAATIEYQLGVLVGNSLLDVALDNALPHVLGAARVSRRPLALLAHVDEPRLPALELATRFIDVDLVDARPRVVDELEESGGVLHRPTGARLRLSCLRPRCALRRATNSAVATAAADSAVHASACDQLSPFLKRGGSSSFQARHPLSSPRSINLPATIAAPAPTRSQVVRRELLLRLTCTVLELFEEMRQARCRARAFAGYPLALGAELDVTARQSALLQITLVVILGGIKRGSLGDLGDDRTAESTARLETRLRLLGRALMLGRVVENGGAVLGAHVGILAVECRRVVILPEHVEKLVVAHFGRIVFHLHHLGVSRSSGAHISVCRVSQCAAEVADQYVPDPRIVSERDLDSPETARSKSCQLCHQPSRFFKEVMCAT